MGLAIKMCGSKTLIKEGIDAVCVECGYRIENYKHLEREMGRFNFKKFEEGLNKYAK